MLNRIWVFAMPFLLACLPVGPTVQRLQIWHIADGPRLILPQLEGQEFKTTLETYVRRLNTAAEYRSITHGSFVLPLGQAEELQPHPDRLKLAVIANDLPTQKHWDGGAVNHLDRAFEEHGAQSYVVPLGLDTLLSEEQMTRFRELLAAHFDALVAAGGDDVDPSLYGERNTHSGGTNIARDRMEIALLQHWIGSSKGLLGICRGQQIAGVALGFSLIQDIPTELPNLKFPHSGSGYASHPVDLTPADSRNALFRIVNRGQFDALTTHHQAVDFKPRNGFSVIARTEGVVEGIQSDDGRVLLMQFHPEETRGPVGPQIMDGIVAHLRSVSNSSLH